MGFLITDRGCSLRIYKRIILFYFLAIIPTPQKQMFLHDIDNKWGGGGVKMMIIKKGEKFPLSLKQETSNTFSM